MTNPATDPLEIILQQCASAAPDPWYPRTYAEITGVSRDSLDAPLEKLRLGGLVRLTEWVQGKGQGYALTPEGVHALRDPRSLDRVRDGKPLPSRQEIADRPARGLSGQTAWDRGEEIREALLNPPQAVVVRALLIANFIVFAAGIYLASENKVPLNLFLLGRSDNRAVQQKYQEILDATGAVNGPQLIQGEWWRLLTCTFVHIGLLHIGMNMYVLYATGRYLEAMWGHARYLVIYLVAGVGGSCLGVMTHIGGVAGASTALCGIIASEAVWMFMNRRFLPPPLVSAWPSGSYATPPTWCFTWPWCWRGF